MTEKGSTENGALDYRIAGNYRIQFNYKITFLFFLERASFQKQSRRSVSKV